MLEQRTTNARVGAFSDCMIVVIMTIMMLDLRRPMDRHSWRSCRFGLLCSTDQPHRLLVATTFSGSIYREHHAVMKWSAFHKARTNP
jgi:uncharacterized membrane protein